MAFNNLDAELLSAFGEPGWYTPAGATRSRDAQVLIEVEEAPFSGMDFDSRHPSSQRVAYLLSAVAPAAARGDALTVEGVTYEVDEVLQDDGRLLKLSVRTV